jgi:hypothetical protein
VKAGLVQRAENYRWSSASRPEKILWGGSPDPRPHLVAVPLLCGAQPAIFGSPISLAAVKIRHDGTNPANGPSLTTIIIRPMRANSFTSATIPPFSEFSAPLTSRASSVDNSAQTYELTAETLTRKACSHYIMGSRVIELCVPLTVMITGWFPVVKPEGTTALIWYRPTKPGARPE